MYAGTVAPSGWLIADGSAVNRTTYSDLFSLIGTAFGVGNGTTTFNIPDLRNKFPIGVSSTKARASTGGEASHVLTVAELASHTHRLDSANISDPNSAFQINDQSGDYLASADNMLQGINGYAITRGINTVIAAGSSSAHNNLPNYVALNYLIKY